MKHVGLSLVGLLAIGSLVSACSSSEGGANPDAVDSGAQHENSSAITDELLIAELDEMVNLYAQALLDNDVTKIDSLVSSEVKLRAREKNSDVAGFTDKMARSLRTELSTRAIDVSAGGILGLFSVISASRDGNAIVAELTLAGTEVSKPFWFVQEDGEYKLNVLAPGFTNPLPAGAAAGRENYLIANYSHSANSISCDGSGQVAVPAASSRYPNVCQNCYGTVYIGCDDTRCGWWTGTQFYHPSANRSCDYNSFGRDGYFDSSNRFYCNDSC